MTDRPDGPSLVWIWGRPMLTSPDRIDYDLTSDRGRGGRDDGPKKRGAEKQSDGEHDEE